MDDIVGDVISAPVDPAWIGVAAELIATFPRAATPRERLRLLFTGLHQRLGINDWIACAAVHIRVSALGHMDQGVQLGEIHLADSNPDAVALCHAVATAPLHVHGEYLAFDPVSFQRCLADARHAGAVPQSRRCVAGNLFF